MPDFDFPGNGEMPDFNFPENGSPDFMFPDGQMPEGKIPEGEIGKNPDQNQTTGEISEEFIIKEGSNMFSSITA